MTKLKYEPPFYETEVMMVIAIIMTIIIFSHLEHRGLGQLVWQYKLHRIDIFQTLPIVKKKVDQLIT